MRSLLSSRGRCGRPGGLAALVAALVLVSTVWAGSSSAGAGSTARVALSALEQQTTDQINSLRVSYGLRPLKFSPALFESADTHCVQMLTGGYFGHQSPAGGSFASRIESFYAVGRVSYYAVGENLFWNAGPISSAQLIAGWMKSPEHRSNLLDPTWRQLGLASVSAPSAPGIFNNVAVTVVTADFGVRS